LKAEGQNQTRPARYRARNPPQFSGKRHLCPAGAAMNSIVNAKLWTKKSPRRSKTAGAIGMN